MRNLRHVIGDTVAVAANWLISTLRNRTNLSLTREEFRFSRISFSQFGEDIAVLRWIEENLKDIVPFYIDAGCFHPIHLSNTLLLHKKGWRGINIDLSSQKIEVFNRLRPNDINVVAALSSFEHDAVQLEYDGGLEDRLGNPSDQKLESLHCLKPLTHTNVRTTTLNNIIAELEWPIDRIGYLNIDCEGHDLEVLKGLDLERYRPALITIEALTLDTQNAIINHLVASGYMHKETLHWTLLFVRSDFAA
jgi:FkbM family methyltransferase